MNASTSPSGVASLHRLDLAPQRSNLGFGLISATARSWNRWPLRVMMTSSVLAKYVSVTMPVLFCKSWKRNRLTRPPWSV
jgi:hypothetical protein